CCGIILMGGIFAGCSSSKNAAEADQLVWPSPPETPRIKFVRILSDRNSVEGSGPSWLETLAGEAAKDRLNKPYGVAVGRRGKVYVTDTSDKRVFVFDTENLKLSFIGTASTGTLSLPLGVAADSTGLVYVTDGDLKTVMVFNEQGGLVRTIGSSKELQNPAGVAVDPGRHRVYVVDSQLHEVKAYAIDGTILFTFGKRGNGDGEFNYPTNIAVGKDGNVYVVETINARVQVFDPAGKFLWKFGSLGDSFGQFTRPKGIAIDSQGNIYVVDAAFNNFQVFDPKGNLLLFVGTLGKQPGMFWLPAGASSDGKDQIYVVDQMNQRVQVFQLLK
ncbi:MAG: 6-bladed beta-propeller, partial [Bacteroidota bacterium]